MKKSILFLTGLVFLVGCNTTEVEKPDNLIDEDKMVDIIYDLSLIEAARVNNAASLQDRKIEPAQYVYKKYKIDSLQFAKSDKYYASNIEAYSKIYDRVTIRIERESKKADSLNKIKPEPPKTPPFKNVLSDSLPKNKKIIDPNFKNNRK